MSLQGISITIWTLVMEQLSGIYVELSFLDATLNFGQALLIFAVFGLDTKEILLPILKLWRTLWYGANILNLPRLEDLSEETKHICSQFTKHHLKRCCQAIAKDTRYSSYTKISLKIILISVNKYTLYIC